AHWEKLLRSIRATQPYLSLETQKYPLYPCRLFPKSLHPSQQQKHANFRKCERDLHLFERERLFLPRLLPVWKMARSRLLTIWSMVSASAQQNFTLLDL